LDCWVPALLAVVLAGLPARVAGVLLVVGLTVLRLAVLGIRGSDISLEEVMCDCQGSLRPKKANMGRRCYALP